LVEVNSPIQGGLIKFLNKNYEDAIPKRMKGDVKGQKIIFKF
jgi:hypothetical protein